MTVQELLESERTTLQYLRSIANSHPNDSEIQRLVSNATHESATRILQLTELLHYRDDNQTQNGTHP